MMRERTEELSRIRGDEADRMTSATGQLDRQEHMRGSTEEARIQAGGELLHGVGACFLGHMMVYCMVLTNTGGGRTKRLLELL